MRALWQSLHSDLLLSIDTHSFKIGFDPLRASRPALQRFPDHYALLDFLHAPAGDLDEKDRVLAALLTAARRPGVAEVATTLAWLALWPGLDALYGRLRRYFLRAPEELVSEIGDSFSRVLSRFDEARVRRVAATVLRNVERDIRDRLHHEWNRASRLAPLPDDDYGPPAALAQPVSTEESAFGLAPQPDPDTAIATLQTALHALIGEEAALVVAVAVTGERQSEVAARLAIAPDAARKRYQRAIARLRTQLAAA